MKQLKKWLPFKREEKDVPVKQMASPLGGHTFTQMRREMDNLLERFMGDPLGSHLWPTDFDRWYGDFSPARVAPSMDIADEKRHIRIAVELPGMTDEDIQVMLRDDALVIRGEKRLEESHEDEGYYRTERSYGAFERTIPLPVEVQAEQVEASFKKGVLTVRLPKAADAPASRQIPVQAG